MKLWKWKHPIVFYNVFKFHSKIPLATYRNNKTNKQEEGADQTIMNRLQTSEELQDKTSFIDPSTGVDMLKSYSPDYLLL